MFVDISHLKCLKFYYILKLHFVQIVAFRTYDKNNNIFFDNTNKLIQTSIVKKNVLWILC